MAKKKQSFSPAAGLFDTSTNANKEITPSIDKKPFSEGITGTQGRKGQRARRMNIPVTDEEYEAIRRGSRAAGMTYGEYVYEAVKFYRLHGEDKKSQP